MERFAIPNVASSVAQTFLRLADGGGDAVQQMAAMDHCILSCISPSSEYGVLLWNYDDDLGDDVDDDDDEVDIG